MSQKRTVSVIQDKHNPNATQIMRAFLHAYDESQRGNVLFHTDPKFVHGVPVRVIITSLAYDDNRPGSFLIGGYIKLDRCIMIKVNGRYDAEKKSGVLEID